MDAGQGGYADGVVRWLPPSRIEVSTSCIVFSKIMYWTVLCLPRLIKRPDAMISTWFPWSHIVNPHRVYVTLPSLTYLSPSHHAPPLTPFHQTRTSRRAMLPASPAQRPRTYLACIVRRGVPRTYHTSPLPHRVTPAPRRPVPRARRCRAVEFPASWVSFSSTVSTKQREISESRPGCRGKSLQRLMADHAVTSRDIRSIHHSRRQSVES